MQTLTINIDEGYVGQLIDFLQKIPQNKREIFQHTKLDTVSDTFESIEKEDSDCQYILDARIRRENGEKTFSVESVMKEL